MDHVHDLPVCGFGIHNPHDPSCATITDAQGQIPMIACGEVVDQNSLNFGKALCRHKREPKRRRCCLVAAASETDTKLAPKVQLLRGFRDNVVLPSKYGGMFSSLLVVYYHFSPPVADLIYRNAEVGRVFRVTLVRPFVQLSEMVVNSVLRHQPTG